MIIRSRKTQIERWLLKMPMMISCEEFEGFILQYLENGLPSTKRFIFETHLKFCKECRDYLEAYQTSLEAAKLILAKDEELPPIPQDLVEAILSAIDEPES